MTQQVPPQQSDQALQQQPAPHPEPKQAPEDRILSPEETENLLRGYSIDHGKDEGSSHDDEQQQMAQEFFAQVPPPPRTVPLPHEQIAQAQQPRAQGGQPQAQQAAPVQPEPALLRQAVQDSQQAGGPTSVPVQQQQPPQDAALAAQNSLLQQQIASLTAQIQALAQAQQTGHQQQVQQPGQVPGPQPSEPTPFNLQVPPQFMAGLFGEDDSTRAMALNGLLNGVAETVARQLRAESQEQAAMLRQEMQGTMQTSISQNAQIQEIQRDMYGTYPELAPYKELVRATAQTVGRENPALQDWSPDLRDLIAERVSPMVPGLYQKVQQVRANRIGSYAVPRQQALPQQQAMPPSLPPGVQPVGVMGGVHGQQAPTLARDAQGNLVYVQSPPQPYLGGPQARPDGRGVSPEQLDIWQTLGYAPY